MRTKTKVLIILLMVIFISVKFTRQISAQQPYVSFQVFYDELSPYGEWVDYPNLGYVWIPDAGPDFVPYSTQGHWIFTDYGWTWISDYRWGWAPFHYGRWDFDNYYGWLWIPDSEWGPAWVSWRRADGYYGWAPMEPGISLSVSFGRGYDSHNDHWIFVRDRDIDRADINHYYINRTDHDRVVRRSTVINNTYVDNRRNTTYVSGPGRSDFQKVSGRQVSPVAIKEYNKPGQDMSNGHISIYRPEVTRNNSKERSAPARLTNLKDVKQPSERNGNNRQGNTNSNSSINKERQQNTANPQRNLDNVKAVQPQNANPAQNIRREPQNNARQQSTSPTENVRIEQQQNNVRQQNSNTPENVRREQQQNNVRQQSSNPPENVRREQQSNNSKASVNSKKEQEKKTGTAREKRKKN